MLNKTYCVDIDAKCPKIEIMFKDDFLIDLRNIDSSSLSDLETHDLRLFGSYIKAESFLKEFNNTIKALDKNKLKAVPGLPKMLLKRRYIATSLMRVKKFTTRHYNKKWKKGTIFQLYDQTYFLTVKLIKIEEVTDLNNDTFFTYHYRV